MLCLKKKSKNTSGSITKLFLKVSNVFYVQYKDVIKLNSIRREVHVTEPV